VISFLSQESGVNFVASQKVLELNPVVSASFKKTSSDEVIKYITKSLGLVYRIDKEIVWIAHPEEIVNEPWRTGFIISTREEDYLPNLAPCLPAPLRLVWEAALPRLTRFLLSRIL